MAKVRVHTQTKQCCCQGSKNIFCGALVIAILMMCFDPTMSAAATHGCVPIRVP
jgi:hypothetical protein